MEKKEVDPGLPGATLALRDRREEDEDQGSVGFFSAVQIKCFHRERGNTAGR